MVGLKYLLDTHALLWATTDNDMLGSKAARIVATTPYNQLGISDITLQEIGLLLYSGRIGFKASPARVLGAFLDYVTVLPITLDIAIAAPALGLPHGDQFDRIIVATTRVHRLTLITKDANIVDAALVPTAW